MDLEIKGKYALVTGGSHGIGLAVAKGLVNEGCHVAICARDPKRLDRAVSELKKGNVDVLGLAADAMIPSDIHRVTRSLSEKWGTLHILVNNVGGGGGWGGPTIEETEESVWIDTYNKNAMAAVRFTKWAVPLMQRQKWGRVVTLASIQGKQGGWPPWYSMAKSAEISLMKTLALDSKLAGAGITFNTVAPGAILIPDTFWDEVRKNQPERFRKKIEDDLPLGRFGTPEEVANVVLFVCSQKASLVNGACLAADGAESKGF